MNSIPELLRDILFKPSGNGAAGAASANGPDIPPEVVRAIEEEQKAMRGAQSSSKTRNPPAVTSHSETPSTQSTEEDTDPAISTQTWFLPTKATTPGAARASQSAVDSRPARDILLERRGEIKGVMEAFNASRANVVSMLERIEQDHIKMYHSPERYANERLIATASMEVGRQSRLPRERPGRILAESSNVVPIDSPETRPMPASATVYAVRGMPQSEFVRP